MTVNNYTTIDSIVKTTNLDNKNARLLLLEIKYNLVDYFLENKEKWHLDCLKNIDTLKSFIIKQFNIELHDRTLQQVVCFLEKALKDPNAYEKFEINFRKTLIK